MLIYGMLCAESGGARELRRKAELKKLAMRWGEHGTAPSRHTHKNTSGGIKDFDVKSKT